MRVSRNADLSNMSDGELETFIASAMAEKLQRAVVAEDPDVLIDKAMQELYTPGGVDPLPPKLYGSMIALAGSKVEISGTKRKAKWCTVKLPDSPTETWQWDENTPTWVVNKFVELDKTARSVALHTATEGLIIIQHALSFNGERNTRTSCKAWEVQHDVDEATGEIVGTKLRAINDWTPSYLPPPSGMEDTRSHAGKQR